MDRYIGPIRVLQREPQTRQYEEKRIICYKMLATCRVIAPNHADKT